MSENYLDEYTDMLLDKLQKDPNVKVISFGAFQELSLDVLTNYLEGDTIGASGIHNKLQRRKFLSFTTSHYSLNFVVNYLLIM